MDKVKKSSIYCLGFFFIVGLGLFITSVVMLMSTPDYEQPYAYSVIVCPIDDDDDDDEEVTIKYIGLQVSSDDLGCPANLSIADQSENRIDVPKDLFLSKVNYQPSLYVSHGLAEGSITFSVSISRVPSETVFTVDFPLIDVEEETIEINNFEIPAGSSIQIYRDSFFLDSDGITLDPDNCSSVDSGCSFAPYRSLDKYYFPSKNIVFDTEIPLSGSTIVIHSVSFEDPFAEFSDDFTPVLLLSFEKTGFSSYQLTWLLCMIFGIVFFDLAPGLIFFIYNSKRRSIEDRVEAVQLREM